MSLRWFKRLDVYYKDLPVGEHELRIQISKRFGFDILCTFHVDKLIWQEDDECYLYEPCDNVVKSFENMSCCLESIHRYLKRWTFTVDCLQKRTYYFGRQNSRYNKEF